MEVNQINLKTPSGMSVLMFLTDKWALVGFSGMLLNIFSLLENADLPSATGFSGLVIVGVAVYQKIREDRRKQADHEMRLKIVSDMLSGEIERDDNVLAEFMTKNKK